MSLHSALNTSHLYLLQQNRFLSPSNDIPMSVDGDKKVFVKEDISEKG